MSNAVTLVIEGSQGEPGELVAETALRDTSPRDGRQGHQTLVSLARVLTVDVVALLAVQGSLLLDLVNKGRDQRVHLYSLPGENLKVERIFSKEGGKRYTFVTCKIFETLLPFSMTQN